MLNLPHDYNHKRRQYRKHAPDWTCIMVTLATIAFWLWTTYRMGVVCGR